MKIAAIRTYQVDLPLKEGRYSWSEGKYVEVFDSTIVEILTDDGRSGVGEICPLGPFYLPAYAEGARAGVAELSQHLIGLDPRDLTVIERSWTARSSGILTSRPPSTWPAGTSSGRTRASPSSPSWAAATATASRSTAPSRQGSAEAMAENVAGYRAQGYTKFQLKVGGRADDDIARIHAVAGILQPGDVLVADANTGWTSGDALRVANAVRDVDVYIEQPCKTYAECLGVRRAISLPFILDENIDGLDAFMTAHNDGAMNAINLKISKVGGLTKARRIRDLCVALGYPMTLEDSWGGDIVTAAIAALSHSTPERFRFSATDFNSYVTVSFADGAPQRVNGRMRASDAPGLGVTLKRDVVGKPVGEYR